MTAAARHAAEGSRGRPLGRWLRQAGTLAAVETRRDLAGGRSLPLYLLAAAPIAVIAIAVIAGRVSGRPWSVTEAEIDFAVAYREFALRWCVFFGVAIVFANLFRGEILDRTLHYYFLAPVRRELLVAGKYAAGLVSSAVVLGLSTAVAYALIFVRVPWPQASAHLLHGPAVTHGLAYAGITILACVGYGALFMAIGLFVRTPIVPALVVLGWEYVHFLLPPSLKLLSVSYYLDSLLPVPVPEGPVAIIAEPAPLSLAVPGLVAFAALWLLVAAVRVRRMEIRYAAD